MAFTIKPANSNPNDFSRMQESLTQLLNALFSFCLLSFAGSPPFNDIAQNPRC